MQTLGDDARSGRGLPAPMPDQKLAHWFPRLRDIGNTDSDETKKVHDTSARIFPLWF